MLIILCSGSRHLDPGRPVGEPFSTFLGRLAAVSQVTPLAKESCKKEDGAKNEASEPRCDLRLTSRQLAPLRYSPTMRFLTRDLN